MCACWRACTPMCLCLAWLTEIQQVSLPAPLLGWDVASRFRSDCRQVARGGRYYSRGFKGHGKWELGREIGRWVKGRSQSRSAGCVRRGGWIGRAVQRVSGDIWEWQGLSALRVGIEGLYAFLMFAWRRRAISLTGCSHRVSDHCLASGGASFSLKRHSRMVSRPTCRLCSLHEPEPLRSDISYRHPLHPSTCR